MLLTIVRLRINDDTVDKEKGYDTEVTEMVTKLVSLMARGAWLMLCLCFAQGQRLAPKCYNSSKVLLNEIVFSIYL